MSATTGRRGLILLLFAAYLVVLVWAVLWKFDVPHVGQADFVPVKLVPFVATADAGASSPFEVLANIALFVPLGVYLRLLWPRLSWWALAGVVAGTSVALEAAQFLFATGVPDVSDVLANTAGGVIGIVLARPWRGSQTHVTAPRLAIATTVICIIAVAAFAASPAHFVPPRDAGPLSCGADGCER